MKTPKYCPKCKTLKTTSDFYKDTSRADGYNKRCKNCQLLYDRRAYWRKKDRPSYKALKRETSKQYFQNHPERQKAYSIVARHKPGLIKKACEECGSNEVLHMHHPDISKPLEVITLCIRCHEIAHHGERAMI